MQKTILKIIYFLSIFFLAVTGFGQMPIFKRYYIADIPGLEWLAQFYVTHALHYIAAMVLICLTFYIIFDNIFNRKNKTIKIIPSAYTKITMILVLMITGILMMVKNFAGTPFPPNFIIFLDITHLTFCMALLVYTMHTLLTKQKGIIHSLN
ncbi:MAG: hypothetical protein GY707_09130 [Desulfobacteraceae bacterium]|nr:hypothetical protein [Desulfobacteraceae bacterium]